MYVITYVYMCVLCMHVFICVDVYNCIATYIYNLFNISYLIIIVPHTKLAYLHVIFDFIFMYIC